MNQTNSFQFHITPFSCFLHSVLYCVVLWLPTYTVFTWTYVSRPFNGNPRPGLNPLTSYSAKRWRLQSGSSVLYIVFLSIMWLRRRRAARRRLRLSDCGDAVTEQRVQGYGCFFSRPSRDGCLLCICSEELSG